MKLLSVNGEGDRQILGNPRSEDKDMEELVEAKVLCIPPRALEGVEDGTD